MPGLSFSDYLDAVPKVELHLHIAGAIRPETLDELAVMNELRLPKQAAEMYRFETFYDFLEILRFGALAVANPQDFSRIAFECIEDLHRHGNVRHTEIFFNPHYFTPNRIGYPEMVDGLIEGLAKGERAYGVSSRLIACIDRSVCLPSEALQILDWMAQHPRLGRASPLYTIDGNRERKSSTMVVVDSMYTRTDVLATLHKSEKVPCNSGCS